MFFFFPLIVIVLSGIGINPFFLPKFILRKICLYPIQQHPIVVFRMKITASSGLSSPSIKECLPCNKHQSCLNQLSAVKFQFDPVKAGLFFTVSR